MYDYYYYDEYDGVEQEEEDIVDYDVEESDAEWQESLSLRESFRTCVEPSLIQIAKYVVALIGWSLLCRLLWLCCRFVTWRSDSLQHLVSVACGLAVLYFTTGHDCLVVVFLALVAYILMLLVEYYRKCRGIGVIIAIACIGLHFLYEVLWKHPEIWQRIRGIQMVATMKIISLAFDLEAASSAAGTEKKSVVHVVPAIVPFFGYILCPATCVLGPWIPYSAYIQALHKNYMRMRWLVWTFVNAALAVTFLSMSNCLVPLLCSNRAWIWMQSYRDALTVRSSHYFICFLSQATIAAAGIGLRPDATPNALLGHMITKPWEIELPRSLSCLVRSWNRPMHDFLKTYIFRTTYGRYRNYLVSILSTYFVSSLLHGIYLKIYAVLLSLACFAYVESVLRSKLASIFDACITANPCRKQQCPFRYCTVKHGWRSSGAYSILAVNSLFTLLTIIHLAYLGVVMSDSDNEAAAKTAQTDWIEKWSNLGYLNHWLFLVTYLFYLVI